MFNTVHLLSWLQGSWNILSLDTYNFVPGNLAALKIIWPWFVFYFCPFFYLEEYLVSYLNSGSSCMKVFFLTWSATTWYLWYSILLITDNMFSLSLWLKIIFSLLQAHGKKQSSLVVGGSAGNNSQDASIEVFMADSKVSLTFISWYSDEWFF